MKKKEKKKKKESCRPRPRKRRCTCPSRPRRARRDDRPNGNVTPAPASASRDIHSRVNPIVRCDCARSCTRGIRTSLVVIMNRDAHLTRSTPPNGWVCRAPPLMPLRTRHSCTQRRVCAISMIAHASCGAHASRSARHSQLCARKNTKEFGLARRSLWQSTVLAFLSQTCPESCAQLSACYCHLLAASETGLTPLARVRAFLLLDNRSQRARGSREKNPFLVLPGLRRSVGSHGDPRTGAVYKKKKD